MLAQCPQRVALNGQAPATSKEREMSNKLFFFIEPSDVLDNVAH